MRTPRKRSSRWRRASPWVGSEVALGVIPAGTVDLLARVLGVPRRPLAAARVLADSTIKKIDVGLIAGQPFLLQVSAGLDSRIMAEQNAALKRWFGRFAFISSGFRSWWTYDYHQMVVKLGGQDREVGFFAACNVSLYGGGFRLAPSASIFDRRLDLVTSTSRTRASTLGLARDLVLGRHHRRRDVAIRKVDRFEIVSPSRLEVQLDGDVMTIETPCEIRIAEQRLAVLMPG